MVPLLRQRELGVRRPGLDAGASREHQRPADRGRRAQLSLSPWATPGRPSFAERAGVLMNATHSSRLRTLCWMAAFVLLAAPAARAAAPASPGAAASHKASGAKESLVSGMDPSVLPGNDFNEYANGAWLRATQIPADRAYYGTGSMVAELTLQRTRGLLEQAGTPPAGSEARKVGDYYASFMDEATIKKRGLEPLQPQL